MDQGPGLRRDTFLAGVGLATAMAAGSASAAVPVGPLTPAQRERLKLACRQRLTLPHMDLVSELEKITAWARRGDLYGDRYGTADFIADFEARLAALLGYEAACFMPTGTMAQLILLRVYAERSGRRAIGLHRTSHHLTDEQSAYDILHGLKAELLGPADRPLLAGDVTAATQPLAAVSVELPLRLLGGRLPSWAELEALKRTCRDQGVTLHMDGARLWEAQPYYGRSHAEICRGFDSVYVSFYKGIGALGGALIAADSATIAEARIWRRRHGGDVFQLSPYVASAAERLDRILPRMAVHAAKARQLAAALAGDARLAVSPAHTSLFEVSFAGDPKRLVARRDEIARRRGIWLANSFRPLPQEGRVSAALQLGEGCEAIDEAAVVAAFGELLTA